MSSSTPFVETQKRNATDDIEIHQYTPNNKDDREDIKLLNHSDEISYKTRWITLFTIILAIVIAIILTLYFLIIEDKDNDSSSNKVNLWPMAAITQYQSPIVCDTAYEELIKTNSTLSAIVAGATLCEEICSAVGWGEKPDSEGETTLDAMIIYGPTRKAGCVGQLRNIKPAMAVARDILVYTKHTLLVGESAMEFALSMGYEREDLSSNKSIQDYQNWLDNDCQNNFWQNMINVTSQCPPYVKINITDKEFEKQENELLGNTNINIYDGLVDEHNHDTVSMVAIDSNGIMSVGTTTNGLTNKIHGRVGDSPIPGGGSYVIQGVGGCGATGNGDIMVRFLPSYKAVQHMANGKTPYEAIQLAMSEIRDVHPFFGGNMICVAADGTSASGDSNPNVARRYVVRYPQMEQAQIWTCQTNGDCLAY